MNADAGQWQQVLRNATLRWPNDGASGATPRPKNGSNVLAKHRHVVLFFGAEWHPLCRDTYTPQLVRVYRHLKERRGDDVEMIYVSLDRNKGEFERFVGTHPWPAIPYDDDARKLLISAFRVESVAKKMPKLMVLDARGQAGDDIVNRDAIPEIYLRMNKDSDERLAEFFPWKTSKAGTALAVGATCLFCSIQ